nr:MAG TPA: hypothetical protein [Crassvirales sp.]
MSKGNALHRLIFLFIRYNKSFDYYEKYQKYLLKIDSMFLCYYI